MVDKKMVITMKTYVQILEGPYIVRGDNFTYLDNIPKLVSCTHVHRG